ncbi:MAG: hypothetical protein CXX83_00710 [Methanobacteriota archaeon]|nr:MAG: hypothetical protein CXX83_01975 [Euryarchaeota archaeon]PXY71094.1 MAG: hypothetical protein CXX83_00710 [Euryarchaeota archaeon]
MSLRIGSPATHLALAFILLAPLLLSFAPVAAQPGLTPDADMECTPSTHSIKVGPGDSRTATFSCTVTNDYFLDEEVTIEVDSSDLSYSAPGKVTVPANGEETFEIVVIGADRMSLDTRLVNITYQVTSAGPSPWSGSEEELQLKVDVEPFGWPSYEMEGQELSLAYNSAGTVNFTVRNTGNAQDTLLIRIENQSGLEEFGVIMVLSESSVQLNINESKGLSISVSTTEEVGDGRFEVKVWVGSKRAQDEGDPVEFADIFLLQTEAKTEIISLDSIPSWAVAVGVGLLIFAVVGAAVVVVKLVSSRRAEVFDDDFGLDDDFGDDFDDLELDEF